jgi:hypothetical protein
VIALAAIYFACIAVGTYPRIREIKTGLPGLGDPVTHLWTMRWAKACLLEGRSPFVNTGIQAPVGSPIGLVPPMHIQSLLYLIGSNFTRNDVFLYNVLWFASFVFTGVGVAWLAWTVVGSRAAAFLAGLVAMMCTPMMLHGYGHLELINVGAFPLFLVAWIRFVDRPGWGRLAGASGLYLLVAMSAPYFPVMAVYPATLYVVYSFIKATQTDTRMMPWLRARLGWLAGFGGLAAVALVGLFSGQLWAASHGIAMTRPRTEFAASGAIPWGYFVPVYWNQLSRHLLPVDLYAWAYPGQAVAERISYLGVVTLGLVAYAAVRRVRFPRAGYWWSALGVLVILSFGARWDLGSFKLDLPASWGLESISPLRFLRSPARFNLFVAVVAAVVAAAGLRDLLGRLRSASSQGILVASLALISLVDLCAVPFGSTVPPTMPACYARIHAIDPAAAIIEGPQFLSTSSDDLTTLGAYWQSYHRNPTTAGYTAHPNIAFDTLIAHASPFSIWDLAHPDFLANPDDVTIDLAQHVRYRDYVWLFLTHHNLRFVVLHKRPASIAGHLARLDRVRSVLLDALIFEDQDALVFDRDRLPAPTRLVVVPTEGWKQTVVAPGNVRGRRMSRSGHFALFNPDPDRDLTLTLDSVAFHQGRTATLKTRGTAVASWPIDINSRHQVISPPFRLPAGIQELTLQADGDTPPTHHRAVTPDGDRSPISLTATSVVLAPASESVASSNTNIK